MAKAIIAYDAILTGTVYVFFTKTPLGDYEVCCSHCGSIETVELSRIDDALEEHGYTHRMLSRTPSIPLS